MNKLTKRWLTVFLGSFIISLGVAIIVKTDLGISPITSTPLVLSLKFPVTLGMTMLGWNIMLIILQWALLRKDFGIKQMSQLVLTIVYSPMLDFSSFLLRNFHSKNFMIRLLLLIIGCFFVALGTVCETSPRLAQTPGTGFIVTISDVMKKPIHIVKNTADVISVLIATVLSYVFFSRDKRSWCWNYSYLSRSRANDGFYYEKNTHFKIYSYRKTDIKNQRLIHSCLRLKKVV